MDERIERLVMSQPVPDGLVEAIATAPDVPLHEIDRYVEAYRNLPRTGKDDRAARVRRYGLTLRQTRALELAAVGLTRKEIAHAMSLNEETVRNHLSRARYRLGAKNTTHAVAIGIRQGILR